MVVFSQLKTFKFRVEIQFSSKKCDSNKVANVNEIDRLCIGGWKGMQGVCGPSHGDRKRIASSNQKVAQNEI